MHSLLRDSAVPDWGEHCHLALALTKDRYQQHAYSANGCYQNSDKEKLKGLPPDCSRSKGVRKPPLAMAAKWGGRDDGLVTGPQGSSCIFRD